MASEDFSQELREAARHRGLKLVKSRRRKPGAGDFGRFGLTDAAGKPLLGFGKDGLTATANDIAAYLRTGAAATWAESERITPTRAKTEKKPLAKASEKAEARRPSPPTEKLPKARTATRPVVEDKPPETPLSVRKAKAADADAIAALIDADAATVAALLRGRISVLVAERRDILGCIAWHAIPTLQHGTIGRLTLIFVADAERRQGIGTALVEAARAALARQGCTLIEAISDIEISNAHGFFRALGFRQASYRFTIG